MIVSTCNLTMFFFLYYQLYSTRLDLPIQEIAVDNVTVSIAVSRHPRWAFMLFGTPAIV
jgi:hypothetical protein